MPDGSMNIAVSLALLLFSFLLIGVVTDKFFIPSLENIAGWLKLSESVAGATLLAFGSSAPELFTALIAMLMIGSQPSFGVGNIIGSALFQILVVIGFTAIVKTTYLRWRPVLRDGFVYCLAVLMVYLFARDGTFTRVEGILLVGTYLLYLALLVFWSRLAKTAPKKNTENEEQTATSGELLQRLALTARPIEFFLEPLPDPKKNKAWTLPLFFLSLFLIGGGAWIFVEAGVRVAHALDIDPTIIALTIIAGGSSIPEIFSSAIVARRGQGDMAIANALGSNTFDILISLGLPVLLATFLYGDIDQVGDANITSSIILLFATLLMVLGLLALQKFRASRPFGVFLVICYVVYVYGAYQGWLG